MQELRKDASKEEEKDGAMNGIEKDVSSIHMVSRMSEKARECAY